MTQIMKQINKKTNSKNEEADKLILKCLNNTGYLTFYEKETVFKLKRWTERNYTITPAQLDLLKILKDKIEARKCTPNWKLGDSLDQKSYISFYYPLSENTTKTEYDKKLNHAYPLIEDYMRQHHNQAYKYKYHGFDRTICIKDGIKYIRFKIMVDNHLANKTEVFL